MTRFPSFSLGGRERSIMEGVEEHISIVKECVTAFQTMVASTASGDPAALGMVGNIFDLQAKADDLRRDLDARIAEGAFFGGVREDIINLIGEANRIAQAAKDAGRLLTLGIDADQSALSILRNEHMATFMSNLLAALTSLEALVISLESNKKGVVSGAHTVEQYEEAADTEKAALLKELFKTPRTIDPVIVIQLRDFIFAADDIADNSVNASDVLVVLVAKGYD